MYQNLQGSPTINDIWSVPYSNLRLNSATNEKCINAFPKGIPEDAFVVYTSSQDNKGIVVLGYYVTDDLDMTHSAYFHTLRELTLQYEGHDPTLDIRNTECVHISEWVFDDSLRNELYLQRIFSIIASSFDKKTNKYYIWCDSTHDELLFYSLNKDEYFGYSAAIFYFSRFFMNEK